MRRFITYITCSIKWVTALLLHTLGELYKVGEHLLCCFTKCLSLGSTILNLLQLIKLHHKMKILLYIIIIISCMNSNISIFLPVIV